MYRRKCMSCGHLILKSSHSDPYVCRECEDFMINEDVRYAYLDGSVEWLR